MSRNPLTLEQTRDLLERMVATWDNLVAAEKAGDRAAVEKLREGLRRIMERAREATREF
ncbi:MAG TPA: hypothetical protein VLT61_00360 [Anaeromyxobacteraceae bacterium]|nr:hypothetical protein [Anaeromyxobacteraceae bacterium]